MSIGEIGGVVKKQVGTQVYYLATVLSDKIKGITFVPVIDPSKKGTYVSEDTTDGYQRPGTKSRMSAFRKYLKTNVNSYIPPVLISSREGWRFEPNKGEQHYGSLILDAPAAIVDGQHRIGGYIALFEEDNDVRPIDLVVLAGLTREAEMREFITVNSTQRGVPKALTEFLEDQEAARLAWSLNVDPESPFFGRITRTTMAKENLFALHSVAGEIERLFKHGKLADLDEDKKLDILIKYWEAIREERPEEWSDINKLDGEDATGRKDFDYKLLELTGFIAWSRIAYEILGRSYLEGIGMAWDNVTNLVRVCGEVDWRKEGQYVGRTGLAGAAVIVSDMQRLLPADTGALGAEETGV
jgi:DNA sulfur modification protein DndB